MAELQNSVEFLTNRLESSLSQKPWPTDDYSHPTEHFQEHFEPDASNYVTDPVGYQTDGNYATRKENVEELQAAVKTPTEQYREDKVSPVHAEVKPVLSRASSRGERSESPLVKQERKSQLVRRESRAQIQSYSPDHAYIPENVPEQEYEPVATYPEQQTPSYYTEEPARYSPAREPPYEDYAAGVPYYPNQDAYRPPSRGAYHESYQPETNRLRKSSSGESSTYLQQQPAAYDAYYQQGSPESQPVYGLPEQQPVYAQPEPQPQPVYSQPELQHQPQPQPVYSQPETQPVYAAPDDGRKYQARNSRPPSTSEFEQKPIDNSSHELVRQPSNVRRENSAKTTTVKNQRNTPTKFQ